MVCQLDFAASFAALTHQDNEFQDSKNILLALLGKSPVGRNEIVLEAMRETCFRKGNWVLIPPHDGPAVMKNVNIETGYLPEYQLYDLADDPGELHNRALDNPEKLDEMKRKYENLLSNEK
jgi:arylsulfatase A-like enzyme